MEPPKFTVHFTLCHRSLVPEAPGGQARWEASCRERSGAESGAGGRAPPPPRRHVAVSLGLQSVRRTCGLGQGCPGGLGWRRAAGPHARRALRGLRKDQDSVRPSPSCHLCSVRGGESLQVRCTQCHTYRQPQGLWVPRPCPGGRGKGHSPRSHEDAWTIREAPASAAGQTPIPSTVSPAWPLPRPGHHLLWLARVPLRKDRKAAGTGPARGRPGSRGASASLLRARGGEAGGNICELLRGFGWTFC